MKGPPTANGKPGIHHVFARTIKDLVCRYQTMRGFQVHRKAGWDTHGLPVEIEVEKKLGLKHKGEIEQYGVAKFNAECRKSVFEYKDMWEDLTWRMGYWIDMEHPYITCENNYIESVWWALDRYFKEGADLSGLQDPALLSSLRNAPVFARSIISDIATFRILPSTSKRKSKAKTTHTSWFGRRRHGR